MSVLESLTYVVIEPATRSSKPSAAVRQNGQIVFSAAANEIVKYPTNQFFKAGGDKAGNIYLVPATSETPNVIKATKNNESFQFRQDNVLASLGAQYKDRYIVSQDQDGDVVYFKLTKLSKEEAEAEDKVEAKQEDVVPEAAKKGGKKGK